MSFNGTIEVSCSDADFYERKIIRLEDDISILHEELAKVRTKLRIAEDFQIKYHILLESSEAEIQELKNTLEKRAEERAKQKQGQISKANDQKWSRKLKQLEQSLNKKAEKQLNQANDDRESLRRKLSELTAKREEIDLFSFKVKKLQKENQLLQDQLDQLRSEYQRKLTDEIESLRIRLNSNFKDRLANERNNYEQKIAGLQRKLLDQVAVKEEESVMVPTERNNDLEPIKQLLEEQNERHTREMHELDGFVQQKNGQINDLIDERARLEQKYHEDLRHRESVIAHLETTLLEKQKEHQEEIVKAIHEFKELKEQQINELRAQIEELRNHNESQNRWWSDKLTNHDQQIANLTRKFEEDLQRLEDQKNELKLKIVDLTNRLKEYEGDKAAGETQQLLASLNNLQQKEASMANYDDGITYLEAQLARCQRKLEEQSRAVRTANKELSQVRADAAKQSASMFEAINRLKEQHGKQVSTLERQINQLNQQLRNTEKELKRVQRQQATMQHEREIKEGKLKYALQEVQRDYKRAVQAKKDAGVSYKVQFDRASGQGTNFNKLKWLELEKQKNQLESIYREKQEQLRLKLESNIEAKTKALVDLQRRLQIVQKQMETLQRENSRLREELDINKQNCAVNRYHNKLATINLELALAQNIYDKILKAKYKASEAEDYTHRSSEPYHERSGSIPKDRYDEASVEPSSFRPSDQ